MVDGGGRAELVSFSIELLSMVDGGGRDELATFSNDSLSMVDGGGGDELATFSVESNATGDGAGKRGKRILSNVARAAVNELSVVNSIMERASFRENSGVCVSICTVRGNLFFDATGS